MHVSFNHCLHWGLPIHLDKLYWTRHHPLEFLEFHVHCCITITSINSIKLYLNFHKLYWTILNYTSWSSMFTSAVTTSCSGKRRRQSKARRRSWRPLHPWVASLAVVVVDPLSAWNVTMESWSTSMSCGGCYLEICVHTIPRTHHQ